MATLRDIKRRIRSVENTKQITSAMEMVSSAKLRRAQQRVLAARPYAAKLHEIMENLAGVASRLSHPLFEQRPVKTVGLALITASKGLCGSYNSMVIRRAEQFLKDYPKEQVRLFIVGRRGYEYFTRRGYRVLGYHHDVNDLVTFSRSQRAASILVKAFREGEVDVIYQLYTRFINAMSRSIHLGQLLPIEPPPGRESARPYIFEPDPATILGVLPDRSLATQVLSAFLESAASEHGARMVAMGSASRNASELIDALVLQRNRARQAAITKELAEIVGGAEALK